MFVSKKPMGFAPKYYCMSSLTDTLNRLNQTINLLKNLKDQTFKKIIFRTQDEDTFLKKNF